LAIFLKYPLRWKDLFLKHSGILADIQDGDNDATELAKRKGEILYWLKKGENQSTRAKNTLINSIIFAL